MSNQSKVTRRQFMKNAAVVGAGALAASQFTNLASAQTTLPAKWDFETDIIVVGYGGAGAHAAITAADAGSKVIMLEKYPADTETEVRHIPSSRYCGGLCVTAKDAKDASDHLYALSFGDTPKDVCDAWGEGAVKNVAYLNSLAAQVADTSPGEIFPEPTWGTGEYKDELPGGQTIGTSTVKGGGPRMFQILMANIAKRSDKIQVMYETPGKRLIQDPETKEILGVVATQSGKEITIKANKAVALTTGGFEYDEEMKQNFLRGFPSWFYTNPNNTGEGIRMGQAVGGALWHMNSISARAIPHHQDWIKGIGITLALPYFFVNKYGKRWFYERPWPSHNAWVEFVNFSSKSGEYDADPAWIIYDDTSAKPLLARNSKGYLGLNGTKLQYWETERSKDMSEEVAKGWILRADTPEELAAQILKDPENNGRMTPEALKDTFTRFNRYAVAGVDADFGREKDGLVPLLKPPYFAVKVYPGGPNTQGGLKKNAKGQVVDALGNTIPRLYCAGENGSVYGFLYPTGGGNVCEMTIFGQVIGKEMAAEKPVAEKKA